ncbi:MAG: 60S ribosomal export protein NMD3 [Thermoplasmata archaeon]|nr:60S ribosomal export protein NMD3 [Thermoplasmata archaeon]
MNWSRENPENRSIVSFVLSLIVGLIILRYALVEGTGFTAVLLLFLSISIILISILYFFFPKLGKTEIKYECRRCGKLSGENFHGMCESCYRTHYADASRFVKKV